MLLIFPKQIINIVFPLFFHADLILFGKLEDTRDVLFKILQNRTMPLQERMRAAEQLAEQ